MTSHWSLCNSLNLFLLAVNDIHNQKPYTSLARLEKVTAFNINKNWDHEPELSWLSLSRIPVPYYLPVSYIPSHHEASVTKNNCIFEFFFHKKETESCKAATSFIFAFLNILDLEQLLRVKFVSFNLDSNKRLWP